MNIYANRPHDRSLIINYIGIWYFFGYTNSGMLQKIKINYA